MATEILTPNGTGSETSVQSVIGAATHWQACLTNDGSTSYIHVLSQNQSLWFRDLFTVSANVGADVISQVEVFAYTSHSVSAVHLSLRTYSTTYDSTDDVGTGGWSIESWVWATNPFTGIAWTSDELDDLEIGVSLSGSGAAGGPLSDCTQVYAVVTYTVGEKGSVLTQSVINILDTTATGRGFLIGLGGSRTISYGVCWDEYPATPTTTDSGSGEWGKTDEGTSPTLGTFSTSMTGLTDDTAYNVRAYIENAAGIDYGENIVFRTSASGGSSEQIFPTKAITRVTSLVHRYNRAEGIYNLEIGLGETDIETGIPNFSTVSNSSSPVRRGQDDANAIVSSADPEFYPSLWRRDSPKVILPLNEQVEMRGVSNQVEMRSLQNQVEMPGIPDISKKEKTIKESEETKRRLVEESKQRAEWWTIQ